MFACREHRICRPRSRAGQPNTRSSPTANTPSPRPPRSQRCQPPHRPPRSRRCGPPGSQSPARPWRSPIANTRSCAPKIVSPAQRVPPPHRTKQRPTPVNCCGRPARPSRHQPVRFTASRTQQPSGHGLRHPAALLSPNPPASCVVHRPSLGQLTPCRSERRLAHRHISWPRSTPAQLRPLVTCAIPPPSRRRPRGHIDYRRRRVSGSPVLLGELGFDVSGVCSGAGRAQPADHAAVSLGHPRQGVRRPYPLVPLPGTAHTRHCHLVSHGPKLRP